ncbi:MAG: hypothetical protein ACREGH_02030 [Minisyncoccia bacterium]
MFTIYGKRRKSNRGGQIIGILLAIVVIVGMVALYMPIFYQ